MSYKAVRDQTVVNHEAAVRKLKATCQSQRDNASLIRVIKNDRKAVLECWDKLVNAHVFATKLKLLSAQRKIVIS